MPILIFFFIWYFGFARNNPDKYKKVEGKVGKIITALVLLSVFSSFIGPIFGVSIALIALLLTFSPLIVLGFVVAKILGAGKNKNRKNDAITGAVSAAKDSIMTGLTRSVPKRKKIIRKFNKKYSLNLTEEEMDRIVDASYVSIAWEKEIFDMQKEYDTVSQWFKGNTGWLRTYLRIFPVHTISSDFARQHQICVDTYSQIFEEVNPGVFGTVEDCIEAINNEYFSSFDETTFMIVYRHLESLGKRYDLPSLGLVRNESELDKLRRKYDATKAAEGYEQKEMDKRVLS